MDKKYKKQINEFLNEFDNKKLDREKLWDLCNSFYLFDANNLGISSDFRIILKDDDNLGRIASVNNSEKEMKLNYTRLLILEKYKMKSNDPNFVNWLNDFIINYENKDEHTEYETIIYNKVKDPNWSKYLNYLGNYNYLPFEWIQAIFHENQHIKQKEKFEEIKNKTNLSNDDIVYLFIKTYEDMKNKLTTIDKLENYKRDNSVYPIEVDAEFRALKLLKDYYDVCNQKILLEEYFRFSDRTANMTKEEYINRIISDFNYLYSLCEKNNIDCKIDYFRCIDNKEIILNYLFKTYETSKLYVKSEIEKQ